MKTAKAGLKNLRWQRAMPRRPGPPGKLFVTNRTMPCKHSLRKAERGAGSECQLLLPHTLSVHEGRQKAAAPTGLGPWARSAINPGTAAPNFSKRKTKEANSLQALDKTAIPRPQVRNGVLCAQVNLNGRFKAAFYILQKKKRLYF